MVRRSLAVALIALVLLAAVGCTPPKKTETPALGGTLTVGLMKLPASGFRPFPSELPDAAPVTQMIYSGLLRLGERLELICDLCEEFTVSEDQRTLTFRLREGLQWHDGKPLTADDVAFTYRSILAPEYQGARAGELTALQGVQALLDARDAIDREVAAGKVSAAEAPGRKAAAWRRWVDGPGKQAVVVTDDRTITFAMASPYAPMLTAFLLPVSPAHTQEPVGAGPFKLVEVKKGESIRLERHDAFHLGKPYLDAVVFRKVSPNEALGALRDGELDYVPLAGPNAAGVGAKEPIRIVKSTAPGYQYLGVNHDRPPFSDVRVRQALLYGINRKALVESLLHGHGRVVNAHLREGHWAGNGLTLNEYPYDPAKAAELLATAGWAELDPVGYRVMDGRRLQFTLKYPEGNPVREASAATIQRDLGAIGIKVELQKMSFGQLVREVFGERQADAWLLGWDLGVDPDPGPVFSTDNKWGRASGWSSSRSEELLQQGRRTLAVSDRKALYGEWLQLVNQELPYLFLYTEAETAAFRTDRLRGFAPDARGALWNVWEWWIPKEMQ